MSDSMATDPAMTTPTIPPELVEAHAQLLASMERWAQSLDGLRRVWGEEVARQHLVAMLMRLGVRAAVRPEEI